MTLKAFHPYPLKILKRCMTSPRRDWTAFRPRTLEGSLSLEGSLAESLAASLTRSERSEKNVETNNENDHDQQRPPDCIQVLDGNYVCHDTGAHSASPALRKPLNRAKLVLPYFIVRKDDFYDTIYRDILLKFPQFPYDEGTVDVTSNQVRRLHNLDCPFQALNPMKSFRNSTDYYVEVGGYLGKSP